MYDLKYNTKSWVIFVLYYIYHFASLLITQKFSTRQFKNILTVELQFD